MDFILEAEDLVELSDDAESEEDNEEEKDEVEWKWNFATDIGSVNMKCIAEINTHQSISLGEPSKGERVIFSPPPENVI